MSELPIQMIYPTHMISLYIGSEVCNPRPIAINLRSPYILSLWCFRLGRLPVSLYYNHGHLHYFICRLVRFLVDLFFLFCFRIILGWRQCRRCTFLTVYILLLHNRTTYICIYIYISTMSTNNKLRPIEQFSRTRQFGNILFFYNIHIIRIF